MKYLWKSVLTGTLLLGLTLGLCACGSEEKVKVDVHLTYDSETDTLVDSANGITYEWASVSYEPAYVGDAYADWDDYTLYEVKGWNPETLLTEEYSGVGGMLYASDFDLPALGDMEADKIYVCFGNMSTTCVGIVEDADTIERAAELMETGESVSLPQDGTDTYSLKFASTKYDGIYYSILFISMGDADDADHYLYDRGTKRCVKITDDLFYGELYGESTETEEAETAGSGNETVDENGDLIISF